MSVKIIIDSTINLSDDIKNRFTVVPLTVHFGQEEYIDGVTITHEEFYKKLTEGKVLPSTSQATPDRFMKVFDDVVKAGDTAVVICISSKLSGTYQSAVIAAEDYKDKIFVVDSKTTTIAAGILAELALKLADEGMTAKEIAQEIIKESDNVCIVALLDTLEYLKRGGRISKTVAFAGGLLSIKPAVCLMDGKIDVLGKARGTKQGFSLINKEIEKLGGVDFTKPMLFGYTGTEDTMLKSYLESSADKWTELKGEVRYTIVGSVVGTHVGPGAVAVAFFKN